MKKTRLISSVFIITLLLSGIALAEVSSTKATKIDNKIDVKKKTTTEEKVSSTTNIKNIKQEVKSAAELRIGRKLDAKKTKVADAFEKSIQNLKDLVTKVESRISKMESENINASTSKSLLLVAKTKLASAEMELTNLENLLVGNIPTTSTSTARNNERKAVLKNLNLQSEKTKSAIKMAHKYIVDVITSLKRGLMKEKNSTSTKQEVSTTTSN